MKMSGRRISANVLLAMGIALSALGCGQVLDTKPPDPVPDASHGDSGGGSTDAGRLDGATDAGFVDAGCTSSAQCDDEIVCNGVERCVEGSCVDGEPLACDDGVDCTSDSCSEDAGGCKFVPDDSVCSASGETPEICSPTDGGCIPGTHCSTDADCLPSSCEGVWACVAGVCSVVAVPTIPVTECVTTECRPGDMRADAQGWVVTREPSMCDDGFSCTLDRCTSAGSCAHTETPGVCGDPWDCTDDRCDPLDPFADGDSGCVNEPTHSLCGDAATCTDDICDPEADSADFRGCVNPIIPRFCDDGAACTADYCSPGTPMSPDGCVHMPDDRVCGTTVIAGTCIRPVCSPATSIDPGGSGCGEAWMPRICMDSGFGLVCDETGACVAPSVSLPCAGDAECDDGNPCNGVETCSASGLCHKSSNSCPPAPDGSCMLAVCDNSGAEPVCGFRPSPDCVVVGGGSGGP